MTTPRLVILLTSQAVSTSETSARESSRHVVPPSTLYLCPPTWAGLY